MKGRYIFQDPKSEDFKLANAVMPHWKNFQIINLEENHRQGDDKHYADMLNRIRIGKQTEEDIHELQKRVRKKDHQDLKDEKALYLFGKNKPVNEMNEKRLLKMKGALLSIEAICFHSTIKVFKPVIGKDGSINNTPFQSKLKLKIGAKIMLTYNINTADGLTNGSRGELVGAIKEKEDKVTKLIIKFENPSHGQKNRELNPEITKHYPDGTVVEKIDFGFSLSKGSKGNVSTAKVIQFPVRLAFATTSHKIQGQTIKKPRKVVVDIRSVFQPAMAYVMMSRVESIDQLFILEEFNENKVYGNPDAIEELANMNKISLNENPTKWQDERIIHTRVSLLNCGSIRSKVNHISSDSTITISDVICLTETWIWNDEDGEKFKIQGFIQHHNAQGRGQGVSVYWKENKFRHIQDLTEERIQVTVMFSKHWDLIIVYKSPTGKDSDLRNMLQAAINLERSTLVCGDFNMCYSDTKNSNSITYLIDIGFKQLVQVSTHLGGGHIDQVYVRDLKANIQLHSPYYTAKDHDALLIMIDDNIPKDE